MYLSIIQDKKRICIPQEEEGSYRNYLVKLLVGEAGYNIYFWSEEEGFELVHTQDSKMSLVIIPLGNNSWFHIVIYDNSKWGLYYNGISEYHHMGNRLLDLIRKSYKANRR